MATREHDNDQPASPWSSTSVQLSALFLGMLLVVGIAIAIFHHGSQHTHAGKAPAMRSPKNAPAGATTTTATGLCSLPAGDQQIPSSSYPQGTTWQPVGTMDIPQSSTLGAQHVENGINVCFAHNPSGALLAAMNLMGEGTTQIPERQVFDTLAIDVPSAVTTEPAVQDGDPGIQIAGYKYDSYSPTEAVVDVVLRHQQGGLSVFEAPMRWTGNDWKYVFPSQGPISTTLNGAEVEPPYVTWSPF